MARAGREREAGIGAKNGPECARCLSPRLGTTAPGGELLRRTRELEREVAEASVRRTALVASKHFHAECVAGTGQIQRQCAHNLDVFPYEDAGVGGGNVEGYGSRGADCVDVHAKVGSGHPDPGAGDDSARNAPRVADAARGAHGECWV